MNIAYSVDLSNVIYYIVEINSKLMDKYIKEALELWVEIQKKYGGSEERTSSIMIAALLLKLTDEIDDAEPTE